jgi:hypothetical protein
MATEIGTTGQPSGGKRLRTRQHALRIVLPVLFTAAFLGVELYVWITMSDAFLGRALFAFIGLVIVAWWYRSALLPIVVWYYTIYTIDARGVHVRRGVFKAELEDIPLRLVGTTKIEKYTFGNGKLTVTATTGGATLVLDNMPRVGRAKDLLDDLAEAEGKVTQLVRERE